MSRRVLHIVDNLDRCSVEVWLIHMLRCAKARGLALDWTFYCTVGQPGCRDNEARALGAGIVHSPVPIADKAAFLGALRTELKKGRYDVLHSHHDLISGVYFIAALGLRIRRRIVHIHNADEHVLTPSRMKQAILRPILRQISLGAADSVVAVSPHALETFLAGRRADPTRDRFQYLAVDGGRFRNLVADRAGLRSNLGLSAEAKILLFPARLVPEKNPVFAVDVIAELRKRQPDAVLVFAGTGALEAAVRERSRVLQQEDALRMMGWRDDIPEIMAASDWFILPHPEDPMEGFGVAVVEAQLAGLRMLLSRGVSDTPLLPTAKYRMLPLAAGAAAWAKAAMDLLKDPPPSRRDALTALRASPMDEDSALDVLLNIYE
jgi:glycosyltransferase involved in cell wall biosynthesis